MSAAAPPHFTSVAPAPAPAAGRRMQLGPTATLYLLASIVLALLASSSAPTPLYAVYQAEWHFSPITTTVIFGVYAIAVLVSLLILGKLSDHLGRKPALLVPLLVQVATTVVFASAGGVSQLLIARIVQGIATGAALGAIGAGMLDIDRTRGTTFNAVAPVFGTAFGAILSGLAVQYLPSPTRLVYYVLGGIFLIQAIGVLFIRETVTRKPGALSSLAPEIALPRHLRGPIFAVAPVLLASWGLAGFYGALSPALVRTLIGHSSPTLGGLSLFVVAGVAGITVYLTRNVAAARLMTVGATLLIGGVGITIIGVDARSTALYFVGSAISGVGFGGGFQGGIRTVMPLAHPHERAGVLSLLYVVSYFGLGVPAVIGGWLIVHGGGLITTTREYGVAVMVLGALALVSLARQRRIAVLVP